MNQPVSNKKILSWNLLESEDLREFFWSGGLCLVFCLITVFILPVYIHLLPPVMIAWVLFWIFDNRRGLKMNIIMGNQTTILFSLFIAFFLWQICGLLVAESLNTGIERLFKRLSFILFPLVLFYPGSRIRKNIDLIIRLFAIGTFVYLVYCFGHALYNSMSLQDHKWVFNAHPSDYVWENHFYGSRLSDPVHPSYLAMYIVVSVLISFETFFDKSVALFKKGIWIFMIIIFLIVIYLLSARAGMLAGIIIFPGYFFMKFYDRFPKWVIFILLGVLTGLFVIVVKSNERVSYDIESVSRANINETLNSDPRLLIWKSALSVVKKNLIMGVGTGDASKKLTEEFIARGYVNGFYGNLNAHNQFLEILLENGLIGLILFLSILVYMSYMAISQQNMLLVLFIIAIVIFFIFETMLNRLGGVSFFALFTFLLIYTKAGTEAKKAIPDNTDM
jgi:O-antigen ligase